MTVDQLVAALQGLPGDTPVNFKVLSGKNAGQEFSTVNDIHVVRGDVRVYPAPATELVAPAVWIDFA
jgi:hypothetical protein